MFFKTDNTNTGLSETVNTRYIQAMSAWNMASTTEEIDFYFILIKILKVKQCKHNFIIQD